MRLIQNMTRVFSMAVLALAASFFGSPVRAASGALSSKLTLPSETRFGSASLPAGDYTLVVDTLGGQKVLSLRGNDRSAVSLAIYAEESTLSDRDELTLVQDGDGYVVSAVRIGSLGLTFHYAPSQSREERMARAKASMQDSVSNVRD